VGELLRRGEEIPGFGHFVYRSGDPRAVVLLGLVRRAAPKSGQLAVAEAVLTKVRRKSLPEPNIDFAVATLARVAGMVSGPGRRYSRSPARPAGSPTPRGLRRRRSAASPRCLHRPAGGHRPMIP
jgi:hypothetical protein